MSNLAIALLTTIARYQKNQFIKKTKDPDPIQEKFLLKLLKTHQNTKLGQQLGLKDIKTIDQFRDRVPILSYASYEADLDLVAEGQPNILTTDKVLYITLTSGSTGKQKLIPTTKTSQKIVRDASLVSMGFLIEALEARGRKFGKLLVTNSAEQWGQTSGGIGYGTASAGVLRLDKRLFKQFFANPYDTVKISDSITRHYVALLFALCDPGMTGMIANFPMLILRNCHYLEKYAEDLINDINKGTIAPWLNIDSEMRTQLESIWQANPERSRQLQSILQTEGKLTPKSAWSNLSVIATARGGTSDFYFERFPAYFGDTPVFGVLFSSAEGIFSIYPDVDSDGSILALESGFFEFIAEDQWHQEHPQTLLPTEVKVGQRYRILNTSYGGFYRYDIGDIIQVVGFYEQTPLIMFLHRQGGQISSTTEKTNEYHVTKVIQALVQEFNLVLDDFCILLADTEFPARYMINIELAPGQNLDNPQAFLASCDRNLGQFNIHYGISRKRDIPPPRLRILAPGSFNIIRQRQLDRGIPDSQLKFPHISEDWHFLDGLSVLQEVRLPEDN